MFFLRKCQATIMSFAFSYPYKEGSVSVSFSQVALSRRLCTLLGCFASILFPGTWTILDLLWWSTIVHHFRMNGIRKTWLTRSHHQGTNRGQMTTWSIFPWGQQAIVVLAQQPEPSMSTVASIQFRRGVQLAACIPFSMSLMLVLAGDVCIMQRFSRAPSVSMENRFSFCL